MLANLFLAMLTTSGIFYVNIMPALVFGLQDGLKFSAQSAGFVASANTYGAAVGGLVALLTIGRVPWRTCVAVALCQLIVLDLASVFVHTPVAMILLRGLHGVVGGLIVGIGYSLIARTHSPDRLFGLLLCVQYGLGGVGVALLPMLEQRIGVLAIFGALAAFSGVTLAMTPLLPELAPRTASATASSAASSPAVGRWMALSFALAAVFLFQTGTMGLSAYLFGLGNSYGLSTAFISTAGGLSSWVGIGGAALVVVLGTRHGRLWPLAAGLLAAFVSRAALFWSGVPWVFPIATVVAAATHAFVFPYLLGLCAAFDAGRGRSAVMGGLASKLGLASGPAVAALLLGETDYRRLIVMSLVGVAIAAATALWSSRKADADESSARETGYERAA